MRRVDAFNYTVVPERFDMCTPVSIAFDFKAAVPHADVRIVENASHMPTEPNFLREIVRAGTICIR